MEELERRLRRRNSETNEQINQRLETATKELEYAEKPSAYDKIVINDDIDRAYSEIEAFVLED